MITDLKPFITQHLICISFMDHVDAALYFLFLATTGRHYVVANAAFQLRRKSVIRRESVGFRVRTVSS